MEQEGWDGTRGSSRSVSFVDTRARAVTASHGPLHALARRVLEHELAQGSWVTGLADGIAQPFERLSHITTSVLGATGFVAIEARAADLACGSFPWLAPLLPELLAEGFPRAGWQRALDETGPEGAFACATRLLCFVLELLHDLVGDEVTRRLVQRSWPTLARGEGEP